MFRILVAASILAAVVLVVGGQYAEARAADLVEATVAANAVSVGVIDVELVGTPLLYHVAIGRLPAVRVEVTDLEAGRPPVLVDRVDVDLEQVRFDPGDLLDGRPVELDVGSGTVVARVAEAEFARIVARDRPDWEIAVERGAIVAAGTVQGADVRVVAEPRIVDRGLELSARRVETGVLGEGAEAAIARAFGVTVGLPPLPGDLRLTDVAVEGDAIVLRGAVEGRVVL